MLAIRRCIIILNTTKEEKKSCQLYHSTSLSDPVNCFYTLKEILGRLLQADFSPESFLGIYKKEIYVNTH